MSSKLNLDDDTITVGKNFFNNTKEIYYEEDIIRCHKKNIKVCKEQCELECTTYCGKEDLHSYFELHCDQIDEFEEKFGRTITTNESKYLLELLHRYIDELDPNFVNLNTKKINKNKILNIIKSDIESKTNVELKTENLNSKVPTKNVVLANKNVEDSKNENIEKPKININIHLKDAGLNVCSYNINYSKEIDMSNFDVVEYDKKKKKRDAEDKLYRKQIEEFRVECEKKEQEDKKLEADIREQEQKIEEYNMKVKSVIAPESNIDFSIFINLLIKETIRYSSECNVWLQKVNDNLMLISRSNLLKATKTIMENEVNRIYNVINTQKEFLDPTLEEKRQENLKLLKKSLVTTEKNDFIEKYLRVNQQCLLIDSKTQEYKIELLSNFLDTVEGKIQKIGNYQIGDKNIEYLDYLLFNELLIKIINEESSTFAKIMNSVLKKEIYCNGINYFILKNNDWIISDEKHIQQAIPDIIQNELNRLKYSFDLLNEGGIIDKKKESFNKKFEKCIEKCGKPKFKELYFKENIKELYSKKLNFKNDISNKHKNIELTKKASHCDYKDALCFENKKLYEAFIEENISITGSKKDNIIRQECYHRFCSWLTLKGGDPTHTYHNFKKFMKYLLSTLTSKDQDHKSKYFYCSLKS